MTYARVALASAAVSALTVTIKVYDDAVDNQWAVSAATLQRLRIAMVLFYGIATMFSMELNIIFGIIAVFMLVADEVIKLHDADSPHNLDHAFFRNFAVAVVLVFLLSCILYPSEVVSRAVKLPMLALAALIVVAGILDQVITPEECSVKKTILRTACVAVCTVSLLFAHSIEVLRAYEPVFWAFISYNLTWLVTHSAAWGVESCRATTSIQPSKTFV